ncbi:restriction endonuclease subunit S [Listeria grayi]|uniref:restriction endonuclease subunit S n=1 Tax=Listeria grayi TaxID=1641 RepID=UPI0011EA54F5|nr:restriction endonuclease subunit S [Listeria grayi]
MDDLEKKYDIKWRKKELQQLFKITGTKSLDAGKLNFIPEGTNFIGRTTENNGVQGKIEMQEFLPNEANTITATVVGNYKYVKYQKEPYYVSQNINKLKAKFKLSEKSGLFLISSIQKFVSQFDGQQGGYKLQDIKFHKIFVPYSSEGIALEYMEEYMTIIEKERLEALSSYVNTIGFEACDLSDSDMEILVDYDNLIWKEYALLELFGNATRGKRLKKDDRISGKLPFVTAGEEDTGISDFISNDVTIFQQNTVTIDMFGSSKYRNYNYGADDHIAVVHTEHLPKNAVIFITSAIHRAANSGIFSYSNNFYAKDADELTILLPTLGDKPDYTFMEQYIEIMHKLIIKDIFTWLNQ